MVSEKDVLALLTKPQKFYPLKKALAPGDRYNGPLQELLIRMREAGLISFSIHTGLWSKA